MTVVIDNDVRPRTTSRKLSKPYLRYHARLAPPRVRVACADDVDWTVYDRRTRQMRTQRAKVQDIQGIRPRNRDELREKGVLLESGPCRLPELRNRLALQSGLCDRLSRLRSLQHGRTFVIYAGQVTSQRSSQLSKRLSRCPARGAGTCSMSQQRDVPQPGVVCGTTDVKQEQKCDKKEACAACWVVVVLHCPAVQSALQLHAAQSRSLLSAVLATVQSGPVCTGQACTAVKTISAVSRQPF